MRLWTDKGMDKEYFQEVKKAREVCDEVDLAK